jgi:serine/threonine protein kinase
VIEQYELYCLADPSFYDTPDRRPSSEPDFPTCANAVPDGWLHQPSDTWMNYAPAERRLPSQGWKIHVSACLDDAQRVLDVVWDHCVEGGIAFKFLRSRSVLVMFNSKAAFRGSSGKLVTIYPRDEAELQTILADLDRKLSGVRGPYILSDLRYADGPLFVRYGGFAERHCLSPSGERVLALEDGEGRLVPDVRGSTFALPAWVTLPEFLQPHLEARNSVTVEGLPYRVESVLHFSNGGGVYLARDTRTGQQVVLKEGRPHAGLDALGRDAVTRLDHELDILGRLAGLDVVPALLDHFVLGDHHFMVQEFVDGTPLQRLLVHRYPLTKPDCPADELAEYTRWALDTADRVADAVAQLHGRGVVFGDLHPANVLLTEHGRMVLIDFEVSTLAADKVRSALAHPAFQPPPDRTGTAVDEYALACLRLGLFAPQATMMLPLHRPKVRQLADVVAGIFPLPDGALDAAVDIIAGQASPAGPVAGGLGDLPVPGVDEWVRVRDAMATAIWASATPERDDRLFPGDIAQFRPGGGLGFASGAAGVLWALAATGADRAPEHEDWLRKHALDAPPATAAGFYDGLHGVAYVLAELGHRQDAVDILDRAIAAPAEGLELGLRSGLAGMGLNLLHFAELTGDPAYSELAARVVDRVADRIGGPQDVPTVSGGNHPRAGLMYGSSGPALLFLHAYERDGDPALLDRAADALRQDLRRCVTGEDGMVQVDQGWRTLPYLDEGSVGIAMVLRRYLAHRPDEEFATALRGLDLVTRAGYFVQSGLFTGRAGMIAGVGMRRACIGTDSGADARAAHDLEAAELVRGLAWHALPYGGGLTFPGDQMLRLSMDLATGTAGVLFAVATVQHERPLVLPFLHPTIPPHGPSGRRTTDEERR